MGKKDKKVISLSELMDIVLINQEALMRFNGCLTELDARITELEKKAEHEQG